MPGETGHAALVGVTLCQGANRREDYMSAQDRQKYEVLSGLFRRVYISHPSRHTDHWRALYDARDVVWKIANGMKGRFDYDKLEFQPLA